MLSLAMFGLTSCLFASPGPSTTFDPVALTLRQDDPADALKAIQQKFEEAQEEFGKLYQAAKTDEERTKLFQEKYPKPEDFTGKALAIAEANPKTEVARDALVWVATLSRDDATAGKCYSTLGTDFIDAESLGDLTTGARYNGTDSAAKFLEKLAADSPHASVRGKAKFALAGLLNERAKAKGEQGDGARKRAVDLLNECIEEYAGVDIYDAKLGEKAKGMLFALENLVIGKTCPEITGSDADGVEFKLSDYRGKVVFLDFWGFW